MTELVSRGERWFALESSFVDDRLQNWGDWGVDNEVGRLRSVLMRRPGPEIEAVENPAHARWLELLDVERARSQHDSLVHLYREHDVAVHLVQDMPIDRPNAYFSRDLMVMTPEGAILARPALQVRRGEERYVAETLAELGVPIIRTISGDGTFEGADFYWVDRKTVIIGIGNRTNRAGARQIEDVLKWIGVETILFFQVPFGMAHMDEILNFADRDLAVLFPWQTPFEVADALRRKGYRLVEIESPYEARIGMASNFVCLKPGLIVTSEGNPKTKASLEEAGVEVLNLDVSELQKGWGSIHCMTVPLNREPVDR